MGIGIVTPYQDSWREKAIDDDILISELGEKLRRAESLAEGYKKDSDALKFEIAQLRARLANEMNANRRLHDKYIPTGDSQRGYFCAMCGTESDHPFEDNYCTYCGTAFDWRTRNDELDRDETFAYDLAGDR